MEARVVLSIAIARKLIQEGFPLVDIKPDRTDETRKSTVFVFKRSEYFDKRFETLTAKKDEELIEVAS